MWNKYSIFSKIKPLNHFPPTHKVPRARAKHASSSLQNFLTREHISIFLPREQRSADLFACSLVIIKWKGRIVCSFVCLFNFLNPEACIHPASFVAWITGKKRRPQSERPKHGEWSLGGRPPLFADALLPVRPEGSSQEARFCSF